MNIVILGPGAIGCLWAYRLYQSGHNVSLWSRDNASQLTLALDYNPSLLLENKNVDQLKVADLVLITVKSWQVELALMPILKYIHHDTILTFIHNGMGALERIKDELTPFPVLLSTTSHSALLTSPFKTLHTGKGKTFIGNFNSKGKQCRFICDVLHHAFPDVQWQEDITSFLWKKLAVNCVINPLTALHQCQNGELASKKHTEQLDKIINEVHLVMGKEKIVISPEQLKTHIQDVIKNTSKNLSSMHQDIALNRPTEIDFITGYLIKRARIHKIAVPENETLYNQIKSIECRGTNK